MRRVIEPKAPRVSSDAQRERWPIVVLRPSGDGRAVARAVVEILVRRALVAEGGLLPASADALDLGEHTVAEPTPAADDPALARR